MTTVAKGDKFEARVYEAIKKELESKRLGLLPNSCTLHRKKGYYSRDREREIIVDISIEVTLPGAANWSILWVWECKDYGSPIPVDDIEEFWAKLQQIAGVNVKGGFATTAALQVSALSFARSKGISVVRLLPDDQVSWLIYNLTPSVAVRTQRLDSAEFINALTNQSFRGANREFYALSEDYIIGDWTTLLRKYLSATTQ